MDEHLIQLFDDRKMVEKIQKKLPYLFYLAELESSRDGKVGMEVGSVREKILIALLIYKFGRENVKTGPITEPEVDVILFGNKISIKTTSDKSLSGVKLIWTVDAEKVKTFAETWEPKYDMILVHINWGSKGGLYYIPVEAQKNVFKSLGKENYIKLPKQGTNPRGVEISKEALRELINHKDTRKIEIIWSKEFKDYMELKGYDPYKRWVELWEKD